jgi:hypothetical protein
MESGNTSPMPHAPALVGRIALVCSCLPLFGVASAAREVVLSGDSRILVERSVEMTTRDGVKLRADVYRPEGDGKYPVVLERTPYDKRLETFGPQVAARGYVFIAQDVRGRFASDGEWYPLKHEEDDGYDAVEWAAALPYANGKVGMYGPSYLSAAQLLAAVASPPHLSCIMPFAIASNCHEQWMYQGGAFSLVLNEGWSSALAINTLEKRAGETAQPSHWDMKLPPAGYPMLEVGPAPQLAPYYYDWLKHPDYDEYWKRWSIEEHFSQIRVPALHVGAWYDYFEEGPVRNFLGIRAKGGSEAARKGQRLLMIVGGHAGAGPKIGDVDFGKDSVVDIGALALRWYDYVMKGIDNGMASERPVRLFVTGANKWVDEDDWPVPGSRSVRYYLHSSGKANSLAGDGLLSTEPPGAEAPDCFIYDPADPVPTTGGPTFVDPRPKVGPCDQRDVEKRQDVLVYTTAAFGRDTGVMGSVALELEVSSSAVDTDFTGKLVDVRPDGTAINLKEGIIRTRYRLSRERVELMRPGDVCRVSVDLGSAAHVFLAGHRMRIEVSSSNFPHYDRNLNTGAGPGDASPRAVPATNQVYHDSARPSALVVAMAP